MFWVPLVVFVAHMVEEFSRFPQWATRHFGATSKAWYVYSHCVLVAAMIAICNWATGSPPQTWAIVLVLGVQWSLICNAAFHIYATIKFREYSPGLITGVFLFFPSTAYLFQVALKDSLLTFAQFGYALALGTLSQVLVVASLYLPMNVDWRLRMTNGN